MPNDDVSRYKIKKLEISWDESWWDRLCVHTKCWKAMQKFMADKRNNLDYDDQKQEAFDIGAEVILRFFMKK